MGRLKRDDDRRMHPLINTNKLKNTQKSVVLLLRSLTAASLLDCCFTPRRRRRSNNSMNHKWRKPSAALGATKWSISLKSSQKTKNKKRTLQSAVECRRRRRCVWFPLVCGAAELRHFLPLKWSKQARLRVKHSYDCLERFIMRWAANKNSGKRSAPFRMSG